MSDEFNVTIIEHDGTSDIQLPDLISGIMNSSMQFVG
jgi:hypothetical protein